MAKKEKKAFIFYGSPFRSKVKKVRKRDKNNKEVEVPKVITPYVIKEFEDMSKATKYVDKNNWNLLYDDNEGIRVRFVVMCIEEV